MVEWETLLAHIFTSSPPCVKGGIKGGIVKKVVSCALRNVMSDEPPLAA